jgi:hypothetical protein
MTKLLTDAELDAELARIKRERQQREGKVVQNGKAPRRGKRAPSRAMARTVTTTRWLRSPS